MTHDYVYIVYKTTNLINGRYYIGKHRQIRGIDFDGYLGSGIALQQAIRHYGSHNFSRETIAVFDDENVCYQFEEEYLGESWKNRICYNLAPGGDCGVAVKKEIWWANNPDKKKARQDDWLTNNPSQTKLGRKRIAEANKNRLWKDESRVKLSQAITGIPKPKTKCPHCERMIANNMLNRYHNDNCKEKK